MKKIGGKRRNRAHEQCTRKRTAFVLLKHDCFCTAITSWSRTQALFRCGGGYTLHAHARAWLARHLAHFKVLSHNFANLQLPRITSPIYVDAFALAAFAMAAAGLWRLCWENVQDKKMTNIFINAKGVGFSNNSPVGYSLEPE